jgi:prepilin-type N-terminal cleavage/methylation domain-containing protein
MSSRSGLKDSGKNKNRSGFTLLEVLVVIVVIAMLMSMVLGAVWMIKKRVIRAQAVLIMQQMNTGVVSMKKNYDYDPMSPLGVHTTGRLVVDTVAAFYDPDRDFGAAGISSADKIYLLTTLVRGERNIDSVGAGVGGILKLSGSKFLKSMSSIEYFIVKADGTSFPEVDLAKELDAGNPVWKATFQPHLNGRRIQYFPCGSKSINLSGDYVDPWDRKYEYGLVVKSGVIVERVRSSGEDAKMNTKDDLERVFYNIPFGG